MLVNFFSGSARAIDRTIILKDWSLFGGAESLDGLLRRRRTVKANGDQQDPPQALPRDTSDFLWTMTEEPHRSRRMAILKAHPEVELALSLKILRLTCTALGHETNGLRAFHEVGCTPSRIYSTMHCVCTAQYASNSPNFHNRGVCYRGNSKSQPLLSHPRDHAQPCFPRC
jgi:hypothetical protein